MAFFCAGSTNVGKKKDESSLLLKDSGRRHHQNGHHHPHPAPYFTQRSAVPAAAHRYPAGYSNGRSWSMSEKVHDIQPATLITDQFLQKLIVVEDYIAHNPSQLLVKKGEKVEVIRREGDMLYVRNDRGKEGYVPNRNCVPPVASTRRPRANSGRSLAVRQVASGDAAMLKPVPMFPSNSAGKVVQYNSPPVGNEFRHNQPIQRTASPLVYPNGGLSDGAGSNSLLYQKQPSSSRNASNSIDSSSTTTQERYSPALLRSNTDLQDELGAQLDSCVSLNNSQNETSGRSSMSSFEHSIVDSDTRRPSSSDDSGTVEMQKEDGASTIHCGDTSSDDGSSKQGRSSSGTNTPFARDRPLPSLPKEANQLDDVPPPVPPRHTSLERSAKQSNTPSVLDDLNPYSKPIDALPNSETESSLQRMQQQHHVKSLMDIRNEDCGVNAPYSEVFRGTTSNRGNCRHDALSELKGENNPRGARRAASFTKQRVSTSSIRTLERKTSPMVNGDKRYTDSRLEDEVFRGVESSSPGKLLSRFRKYLWGMFTVMEDFNAVDENEVSVRVGEHVMVFNQDDKDWFWVVKHKTDNTEGFVPSSILHEVIATDTKYSTVLDAIHSPSASPNVVSPLSTTPTGLPNSKPASTLISTSRGRSSSGTRAQRGGSAKWSIQQQPQPQHRLRQRVHSTGNAFPSPAQSSNNSSSEVLLSSSPTPTPSILTAPSSPPPPYAELDPSPLFLSQQPVPPPPLPGMTPPTVPSMTRTQSQSVVRNRTYQTRSRVSTPHMYYPHTSGSRALPSHLTRSSNQLVSPLDSPRDPHSSYPCSPTSTTGGTLV